MWKMPAKKQYHNQQCFPHTEHVQVKRNIILILNYRKCQNISGENQIIKIENALHIWINIGYICELFCNVACQVTLLRVLQTVNYKSQLYCAVTSFQQNFSRFKIFIHHIHNYTEYNQQLTVIGQLPTASGILLMVSRIIYLFK